MILISRILDISFHISSTDCVQCIGVPVEDDEVSPVRQKTYAKRDYEAIIQRLLGRIESLTATRQRLLSAQLDYELKLAAKESGAVFMPHVIELVAPVVKQDDESANRTAAEADSGVHGYSPASKP